MTDTLIRPVHVLNRGATAPADIDDGPTMRVFARRPVLGLKAGAWGDVDKNKRGLEECLRKGFVLVAGPDGEPAPLVLGPRRCCGG